MKKIILMKVFKNLTKSLLASIFMLAITNVWGQNSLNSGDFDGGTWGSGQAMSSSAGSSLIITKTVSTAGEKYFRFYGDGSPCGEYQPNTNGDEFTNGVKVTSPNANCGSSKAWQINVPTATSHIVFKTDGGNDGIDASIAFVIEGDIRTVSTVSDSHTVYENNDQTITATLDNSLNSGQGVYLRYTDDAYTTSTVIEMSSTGVSYSADIPSAKNVSGATISYYVFTSGDGFGTGISHNNADFYTINLNNNGGSNYSYSVLDHDNDTESYAPTTQIPAATFSSLNDSELNTQSVFTITIQDQDTTDDLNTIITKVRLKPHTSNTADWTDTLQGFLVNDGTNYITPVGVDITDTYIDFTFNSGDVVDLADATELELTFEAYLNTSNIVENSILSFMVDADDHGFTADASGSDFIGILSSGDFNSNDFTIDVEATELQFTQQPTSVEVNTVMAPAVTVAYTDVNGNVDVDYTGDIDMDLEITTSGSVFAGTTTLSVDAVDGVVTFSDIEYTVVASGVTITATDDEYLGQSVTSNPFNVNLVAEECSQLFISEYGHNSSGGNYIEIYNPSGSDILLANYQIWRGYNGDPWSNRETIEFDGTSIPAHGVYVIRDTTGGVSGSYQESADFNYTGNDNIGLAWNGGSGATFNLIDSVGTNDGSATAWTVAGELNATNNNTLIRKKIVNKPNTDWAISSASEWTVSLYTQANLNSHHSNCSYYPCSATSETAILIDFDTNNSGWTTSPGTDNDGDYDYFDRVKLSDVGSAVELNKGGSLATDYFFAAQDTDDAVSDSTPELYINDVDISGLDNLVFSISIAEDDKAGEENWHADTSLYITYDINNTGSFTNLIAVEAFDGNDSRPAIDTDFNGIGNVGDGNEVTDTFQVFTKSIEGSGDEIDIKIVFSNLDEGLIDIALDDIKITGDRVPVATYTAGAWVGAISPTVSMKAVIDDDYNTSTASLVTCKCEVKSGKTLTIGDGEYLLVAGAITNEGTIEIEHEGSLVQLFDSSTNTNSGSGIYKVHKTTRPYHEYDYNYWSSPVVGETVEDAFVTNSSLVAGSGDAGSNMDHTYYLNPANYNDADDDVWDDNLDDWVHYTSGVMDAGKGYIAMGAGSDFPFDSADFENGFQQAIHFDGTDVNNGVVSVSLVDDADSSTTVSSNLVGNPYPSAIDAVALYTAAENNPGGNPVITQTAYLWSHDTQIAAGGGPWAYNFTDADYATLNLATGVGVQAHAGGANAPSRYIASGQGFMVEYNPAVNGVLTFNNSMRLTVENTHFMRTDDTQTDMLWLNMNDETGLFRQIAVGFYDEAVDTYDKFDSKRKLFTGEPNFYSIPQESNDKLAIQGSATFNDSKTVNLGIEIVAAGTYEINIDHFEGVFTEGQAIYLEDTYENIIHDFANGAYSFTSEIGDAIEDRFILRFTNDTLGIDDDILNSLAVYPNPSTAIFNISLQSNEKLSIEVYDLTGKIVKQHYTGDQIDLTGYAKGIYFAKLSMNGAQTVKKLVLK